MARSTAATSPPWTASVEGRDHTSGDSVILVGLQGSLQDDMYVSYLDRPTPAADLDFIAHAREDVPRLADALIGGQVDELSSQELTEIAERVRLASTAPWEYSRGEGPSTVPSDVICVGGPQTGQRMYVKRMASTGPSTVASPSDFEFIAHAREDLPQLLEEVGRLRTKS